MSAKTRDHKITPLFVSTVRSRSTKRAIRHGRTDGQTGRRTNRRMDKRTDGAASSFKLTVKHYTALKAEARRGKKLIDRRLSSDYYMCILKQVEPALSCSYLIYINSHSLM